MNVTRDVVKDLLPLYLAGEASADTRALVESHLAHDPELARQVEAARGEPFPLPASPALPPTAEMTALEQTRQLLKTRNATLSMALVFTAIPLSFTFEGSHLTFLVLRDAPVVAMAWWATAAVMWLGHFAIRRKLRRAGI